MMRVLSLFSGGGLGDYGLEKAGFEIVGQVEIDKFCQEVLRRRWPEVPKWTDIRGVLGSDVLAKCGEVGLVSGGFPCQDISQAGRGAGIKGARSGLWKEMLRVIREVRPRYVLVENVSILLGRGLGVVLGDLAESGYDTEWDCIPASAIGAPHQRDRVWILAYADGIGHEALQELRGQPDAQRRGQELADTDNSGRVHGQTQKQPAKAGLDAQRQPGTGGPDVAHTARILWDGAWDAKPKEGQKLADSSWWKTEPAVGRVAHGTANRVDRLKLLGNGQVVQVVEWIGHRILEHEKRRLKC